MNNFERISYIKAANPNNEIRPYQAVEFTMALSQDLKVAIYVMWDCSMLLFNEIPH